MRERDRKVPCIFVMEGATIEMKQCTLKGDTNNEPTSNTAGIVAINADVVIENCDFNHFKSGGIMLQARSYNRIDIRDNKIISCDTNGIYVQGRESKPRIIGNKIEYCRCAAVNCNTDVQATVLGNKFNLNEVGIELCNNSSHLIENEIGKSHENGIKITGNQQSRPRVWKNIIANCGYNGISIQGNMC